MPCAVIRPSDRAPPFRLFRLAFPQKVRSHLQTKSAIADNQVHTSFISEIIMTEQRLERLEDEFETVKSLLMSAASYSESANRKIDRLADRFDQLTETVDRLTQRFDQLTETVDRLAQHSEQRHLESEARIAMLEDRFQEFTEQAERDRSQATLDRAEFRTTIQSLLEVLTQRYNGNGQP